MSKWNAGSRFRRLLAHLSTPLLAALLATILFDETDRSFGASFGVFVFGAYFLWVALTLPVSLLSHRKPRRFWYYLAIVVLLAGIPMLVIGPIWTQADLGLSLSYLTIAMVAALWYWFCADWQPVRQGALANPE